jgi:hypothetical protein
MKGGNQNRKAGRATAIQGGKEGARTEGVSREEGRITDNHACAYLKQFTAGKRYIANYTHLLSGRG